MQHWATATTADLMREIFRTRQLVNQLTAQVQQFGKIMKEKDDHKELKTQVVTVQGSGVENLKELKAVQTRMTGLEKEWKEIKEGMKVDEDQVKGSLLQELKEELAREWKGLAKEAEEKCDRLRLPAFKKALLQEVNEIVDSKMAVVQVSHLLPVEGEKKEKDPQMEPMVDATPVKGAVKKDTFEPVMRRNDRGELVRLSEEDKQQLRKLGYVLMGKRIC